MEEEACEHDNCLVHGSKPKRQLKYHNHDGAGHEHNYDTLSHVHQGHDGVSGPADFTAKRPVIVDGPSPERRASGDFRRGYDLGFKTGVQVERERSVSDRH